MGEMIFAGKTVVITGAGRGLGFWMARRFGQAGAHTVIAEINSETGARAAEMPQQVFERPTNDVEWLIGRKARTLQEYAADYKEAWQ